MLQNILSSGNQKQFIGVALTPGLGLEVVLYDRMKNAVINYARKKVDYNFSTREVQDYTQFKTALAEISDELGLMPKTMAFLALPNVYSDFKLIPTDLGDAEIQSVILSQAEDFYVFKREEPVSGWSEVINPDADGTRKLAFTSFQKNSVDKLKDIFTEVGLHLVGIESSYASTLRGMYSTGIMDDIVREKSFATIMLINTNSYNLFQMDGANLLEWAEVPLAIKSFSTEEAYQAIASSSSQYLESFKSQRLYIVSQTDDINARILKSALDYDKSIIAIDTNKFSDPENMFVNVGGVVDINEAKSMSLACIGAADFRSKFKLVLNVLQNDPDASIGVYFTKVLLGQEIDVTQELVTKLCIFLAILILIIGGSICTSLYMADQGFIKEIDSANSRITQLNEQIRAEEETAPTEEVDMNQIIDEIANTNVMANNFYDSIATDIPNNIWLTRYYNKSGDRVVVQGVAVNILDIYEYYKNLRVVSPQSSVKLTELKVITPDDNGDYIGNLNINPDTDRLYSFEIANIDIDFANAANNQENNDVVDENQIIIKSKGDGGGDNFDIPLGTLDQPSDQMTPTK